MNAINRTTNSSAYSEAISSFLEGDGYALKQKSGTALWQRAASVGLLKMMMPTEFGGTDCSAERYIDTLRALGRAFDDNGFTMGLSSHMWTVQQPILRFGSNDQKRTYLTGLSNGTLLGAYALTEAVSGSDAMALETRAERVADGYVLNGEKTYVGMGPDCDLALVFASTAPERKAWGVSVFMVQSSDPGFIRGDTQTKTGLKSLPMGQLVFDNCFVPTDRRLGPEGAGARIFQATLDWERAFILASHVGAMERQLEECVEFAKSRKSFGKPILDHQSVSNRIADMAVRLETSRLILKQAAQAFDRGNPLTTLAAMTNLHISEAFLASSTDAVRTFGGAGYLAESAQSKDLNDALGGVIYSGTSDVQRQIIARMVAQSGG